MPIEEEKKSKEKQARNRKHKTLIKNQFKKAEIFLQTNKNEDNKEEIKNLIAETQSILDKAKNKKVIHRNKSARKKSKLHKILLGQKKQQ